MKILLMLFLFAFPQRAVPPGWIEARYNGVKVIPHWPRPPVATIVYNDLYPDSDRGRPGRPGGCMWRDITIPKSLILVVEHDHEHETVRGVRGHELAWECVWEVRLKGDPRLGKEGTR